MLSINDINKCSLGIFCYKFNCRSLPDVFDHFLTKVSNIHRHHTRSQCNFRVRASCSIYVDKSVEYRGVLLWNQLRDNVKNLPNFSIFNKANLRDLIAATGLVILLKLDSIVNFSTCMTLKFDGWPWKIIGHLFYTTLNIMHHFKAICELKLELQSRNAQFGSKSANFWPVWPWNLTDDLEK